MRVKGLGQQETVRSDNAIPTEPRENCQMDGADGERPAAFFRDKMLFSPLKCFLLFIFW